MPAEISEVYFDFDWDNRKVRALDVVPESIERARLDWHLDLPFWSSRPPQPLFDLVPRSVIEELTIHPAHARRIEEADLTFPLDLMEHRGRLCIMDGIHRLAKAVMEGLEQVTARRIPRSAIQGFRLGAVVRGPAGSTAESMRALGEGATE